MAAGQSEQIRVDIILNTRAALEELAAMSASADNFEQRITKFGNYLIQSSKKWGVPIKELQRDFAALDAEMKMAGEKGGLPGGIFPGQDASEIFALSDGYIKATMAANGFRMNQEGVVTSISHVTTAVQKLNAEISMLQRPARNQAGQFMGGTDFGKQFSGMKSYTDQLALVQNTIQNLSAKSGSSFKDAGAALTTAFPKLLKDTNLVTVAVENLSKANMGLSSSFKSVKEVATQVDLALSKMKTAPLASGNDPAQLQNTIKQISQQTGATYEQVAAGLKRMGVSSAETQAALAQLNKEMMSPAAAQYAANLQKSQAMLNKMATEGKLNLAGSNADKVNALKGIIGSVAKTAGVQYSEVANQLEKMGVSSAQANAAVKGLNTELTRGTREAQGFSHGIDVIRTALGTLTAIGIFQIINFLTQSFQDATKAARELEDSLFRLGNVEKILSENGAEVSMEGLKKGIKDVKKLFPIFSEEDITQLVAQVAISTKELGFSEQQILDLAKAVGVLNVRSTEEETASQTAQKIISALITDNAKGISGLGLSFKENVIQAEAMSMGFLKAGESASKLTDEQKAQVKYQIVLKNTNDELDNMGEYLDTNTAKMKINSAAWHDMLTAWGQVFTTFAPATTKISEFLSLAAEGLKIVIVMTQTTVTLFTELFKVIASPRDSISERIEKLKQIPILAKQAGAEMLRSLFPQGSPGEKGSLFDRLFGDQFKNQDTPTAPHSGMSAEEEKAGEELSKATLKTEEKIQDIMADARDKRADIDEQYRRKIEDANRDHQQKLQDIARDVQRKEEDAQRNYSQKIEDINRDANEKIAEAQADSRQKDIDAEAEYQRKLRELRERFLFDLEDALRERDARQVLRLIREYQMDKKKLEEKRNQERNERKKDLAEKLADIERERQLKLQAAARELAEKQAEIRLWAERERADAALALQRKLEDARRWHQRELQEYQQYLQRKLQELAKSIMKEYELTAAGSKAIFQLLNSYFGSSGYISGLLQKGLTTQLNGIVSATSSSGLASPTWAAGGFYGAAEGGTFVATRPTKVMFGEKGPEVASFTPLGRTGADVGKVFGDGMQTAQNSLTMKISLANGLVAEIVETSLDSVAAVIEKIGREK